MVIPSNRLRRRRSRTHERKQKTPGSMHTNQPDAKEYHFPSKRLFVSILPHGSNPEAEAPPFPSLPPRYPPSGQVYAGTMYVYVRMCVCDVITCVSRSINDHQGKETNFSSLFFFFSRDQNK